jgi:ribose transport system substrate-binding protein
MKKFLAIMLVAVMVFAMTACGSSGTTGSTDSASTSTSNSSSESGDKYRIGVFFKDSSSMFWRYIGQGCQDKADELGVEFVEYSPASYTDSAGQITMLEDAIASGIDAICIAAIDSTAVTEYLVKAEDAGIPVIVFNTLIPDFEATGKQRCFIGIDNAAASEEVMEKILSDHNYEANVVIIEGTPGTQQNEERCGTAKEVCDKYEGVNVVASQPANANREKAMSVMENILQTTTDIDIVFAINDPTGLGALQAIQAAGVEGIDIVAIDGTPDACTAILQGTGYKYTVDQAPFEMGSMAIQAAYDVLEGKEIEAVQYCGGTIIGPDNAQQHLDTYYPDYEG